MATKHYVDNKKFLDVLTEYRATCKTATEQGQDIPNIPDYIGECFLQIANHTSYRPNFINYSYRDDMIADAVENCVQCVRNFDPKKSPNPFGYFTQVVFYAFIRRINKERRHTYTKYRVLEHALTEGGSNISGEALSSMAPDMTPVRFENVQEFMKNFTEYTDRRKAKRGQIIKKSSRVTL